MKYVILAKGGHTDFIRQLVQIGNERLLDRTIRLLRKNGIKDIIVTGEYKDIDAEVINPKENTYDYKTGKGYWLSAFSDEFLVEPVCFIWGDVYFSDKAIKTIVEGPEDTFYCSYKNKSKDYIKKHDEPFAYKVADVKNFREHIEICKQAYDNGLTYRNPIVWELYRSINGINLNEHRLKDNAVIINDITCDIDNIEDVYKLRYVIGGNMVRIRAKETFSCSKMTDVKEIIRNNAQVQDENTIYIGDIILVTENLAKYLNNELDRDYKPGNNPMDRPIKFEILEVIPEKTSSKEKIQEEKAEKVEVKTKRTRKAKK